jgi:transposase InsO family protein
LPPALQRQVRAEVEQAKRRSGWPARRTLAALGVGPRSSYRWLKEEAWAKARPARPARPYEALPAERAAVLAYARRHAELRHRELARRTADEGVACLSPPTAYRVLKEAGPVCPWRRRSKRSRAAAEEPGRPDERRVTGLMQVAIGAGAYHSVCFRDEHSRYVVHHEALAGTGGTTVSLAAQAAIERLPRTADGQPAAGPVIPSDNGSGYVSREFLAVLKERGPGRHRIRPHCPEESGTMERAYRTPRGALEGEELTDLPQARDVPARVVRWDDEERPHSALGYRPPAVYHRGEPAVRHEERRRKLAEARHRRKETNPELRQRATPFAEAEPVSSN